MPLEFDPSAIRAVVKTADDHWVVEIEMATGGSWGHADTTWRSDLISLDEVRGAIGDARIPRNEDVVGYVEVSLRRAGWRAERSAHRESPPILEVWDLSPASEYGRPKHLFS